ncbi:glycoside hydrolase [Penicillium alfredii]|uniref:Glycoside hydrolase n=1 Tax=Penicillium alfredii TaxID=1506179 RepID=A0A9W9KQQ1_9EURO|nr:glycoside hydrolase [Penicillium alfredii]KAJ5114376.1 glycoside hydrolase [Penicillium alfredii]
MRVFSRMAVATQLLLFSSNSLVQAENCNWDVQKEDECTSLATATACTIFTSGGKTATNCAPYVACGATDMTTTTKAPAKHSATSISATDVDTTITMASADVYNSIASQIIKERNDWDKSRFGTTAPASSAPTSSS